jgi:prefoldin beta subunit
LTNPFEEYDIMSDDISRLPPQVQERLLRLQQVQQTLQSVVTQKQQLELELTETQQALSELEKLDETAIIYKSIGSLLVKAEKAKVSTELTERKELLNTRISVLGKQEERLRTQAKDLQARLQKDLSPVSTPPSEPEA